MSSAADSRAYRERRKNGGRRETDRVPSVLAPELVFDARYVDALLDQIADLKEQLAEAHRRDASRDGLLRHVTENFVTVTRHVTERLAILAAGFGGKGGSRSGSPSPSETPEKEEEERRIQDLNGETHVLVQLTDTGTVTVTEGDASRDGESVTGAVTVTRHVTESGDTGTAPVFDSQRAVTELRRKPVKDEAMVAKAQAEIARLQQAMGGHS